MSLYNIFFCSTSVQFYVCKHSLINKLANVTLIESYPVNNHILFDYAIKLDSINTVNIRVSSITKICLQSFELNISQAHRESIKFNFLRDHNFISNIGHCLLNCINDKQIILQQYDSEIQTLQTKIECLHSEISVLQSCLEQCQSQMEALEVCTSFYL